MKPIANYTLEQMEEIIEFIAKNYEGDGYIAHETESDYVHTDVYIAEDEENGMRDFITFGMGAALMDVPIDAPLWVYERIELAMHTSLNSGVTSREGSEALSFLVNLSKYPFRNNTWFGPGHTVDVPKSFADTFGYDFVLLEPTSLVFSPSDIAKDNDVDEVKFFEVIPIYADEREWIVKNNSFIYLALLNIKFGNKMCLVDVKREHYIPSEEDLLLLEEYDEE